MQNLLIILMVCVAVGNQQTFVDTAPVSQGITEDNVQEKDFDVQQLKNLKKLIVKENGELIARMTQPVDTAFPTATNKSVTKIKTDVEIPSKEIHKSLVQLPPDYEIFRRNNNRHSSAPNVDHRSTSMKSMENVDSSSEIQYSPLDMAEYVFWTGDEKGVTLAIEEFLQEGLMTREEAISFLQEIKYNLGYLKNHYTQIGMNSQPSKTQAMENKSSKYIQKQEANKKRVVESTQHLTTLKKDNESSKTEDSDYDELLDKLLVADFLYAEYSLEEIIYQLAKEMFTQSLTHGSVEAQQALQKFTNFLEVEAEQGHITKALEKKVLDVLIASLADTLTEQPELLTAASESPTATDVKGQDFIKQILELKPDNKLLTRNLFTYKHQKTNNQNHDQSSIPIPNHVQFNFEKYT